MDLDGVNRLAIGEGGEGLGLLGRDDGVPLDQASHDISGSLDIKV